MKYGNNQWARISSLLVRKTPKQCKARWYEWLDPSIKKTEWSKEEEEKLLHLAKVMPMQWRTIAPLVGRTANQCLEHYERLLDQAQRGEGEDAGPSYDESRKLKPGEVDTIPETKPARPDAIDMDEDEKEMLSEARARLANTQGKKAKRKAREKQLEEAKRIASLQKRRELRAAGLSAGRYRIRGLNYNADIPFERKPLPGFFDTEEEMIREAAERADRKRFKEFPELTRDEAELKARKEESKKRREFEKRGVMHPSEVARLERLAEEKFQNIKRSKLVLPDPIVGESELREFVKLGITDREARDLVATSKTPAGMTSQHADNYKKTLESLLLSLPRPTHNFELSLPEISENLLLTEEPIMDLNISESAEVSHLDINEAEERRFEISAIKKGYPIPKVFQASIADIPSDLSYLERAKVLAQVESHKLVAHLISGDFAPDKYEATGQYYWKAIELLSYDSATEVSLNDLEKAIRAQDYICGHQYYASPQLEQEMISNVTILTDDERIEYLGRMFGSIKKLTLAKAKLAKNLEAELATRLQSYDDTGDSTVNEILQEWGLYSAAAIKCKVLSANIPNFLRN